VLQVDVEVSQPGRPAFRNIESESDAEGFDLAWSRDGDSVEKSGWGVVGDEEATVA
jgi:hypothetical protein